MGHSFTLFLFIVSVVFKIVVLITIWILFTLRNKTKSSVTLLNIYRELSFQILGNAWNKSIFLLDNLVSVDVKMQLEAILLKLTHHLIYLRQFYRTATKCSFTALCWNLVRSSSTMNMVLTSFAFNTSSESLDVLCNRFFPE